MKLKFSFLMALAQQKPGREERGIDAASAHEEYAKKKSLQITLYLF